MSALAAKLAAWATRWCADVGGRAGALAVEQVVALDPRRRLCLVRCGSRRVVLLTGGGRDMVVGWIDAADTAPPA